MSVHLINASLQFSFVYTKVSQDVGWNDDKCSIFIEITISMLIGNAG